MANYDVDKLARVLHKSLWEAYYRNVSYKPLDTIEEASPFLMAAIAAIEEIKKQQSK